MDAVTLNQITQPFMDALKEDSVGVQRAATTLFYYLAVIQLAFSTLWMMLAGDGLGKVFNKLVSLAFTLGFFYGCIAHGGEWISQIINGFIDVGKSSGVSAIDPTDVMGMGLDICEEIIKGIFKWGLLTTVFLGFFCVILCVFIALIFALIAAELIVVLVKSYFLVSLSSLFFAFGGCEITREMTVRYFQSVLGIGLQLMTLYFLIGIGLVLSHKWIAMIADAMEKQQLMPILAVFASVVVFYLIVQNIPAFIASLAGAGKFRNYGGDVVATSLAASAAIATGMQKVGSLMPESSFSYSKEHDVFHGFPSDWSGVTGEFESPTLSPPPPPDLPGPNKE